MYIQVRNPIFSVMPRDIHSRARSMRYRLYKWKRSVIFLCVTDNAFSTWADGQGFFMSLYLNSVFYTLSLDGQTKNAAGEKGAEW